LESPWPEPVAVSLAFGDGLTTAMKNALKSAVASDRRDPAKFAVVFPAVAVCSGQRRRSEEGLDVVTDEAKNIPCWLEARYERAGADTSGDPEWKRSLHLLRPDATKGWPRVVHLLGAPRESLDDLDGEDREWLGSLIEQGLKNGSVGLHHDLLMDEFAVARRIMEEHATAGRKIERDTNGRPQGPPGCALPAEYRPTLMRKAPRLWIAAGVPLGDPTVRQRLAALVLTPDQEAQILDGRTRGVVINRSYGLSDSELLHWSGFELYRGDMTTAVKLFEAFNEVFQ